MNEPEPVAGAVTVIAASTIEPAVVGDDRHEDSWMVIETLEQGRLLLFLPGVMYQAMLQALEAPSELPGPGRLVLTTDEAAACQARIDGMRG